MPPIRRARQSVMLKRRPPTEQREGGGHSEAFATRAALNRSTESGVVNGLRSRAWQKPHTQARCGAGMEPAHGGRCDRYAVLRPQATRYRRRLTHEPTRWRGMWQSCRRRCPLPLNPPQKRDAWCTPALPELECTGRPNYLVMRRYREVVGVSAGEGGSIAVRQRCEAASLCVWQRTWTYFLS